jgi:hypothetical protein
VDNSWSADFLVFDCCQLPAGGVLTGRMFNGSELPAFKSNWQLEFGVLAGAVARAIVALFVV